MKQLFRMTACCMGIMIVCSCSSEDDAIGSVSRDIDAVRGGEIHEGLDKPEADSSDALAMFFLDELHAPYWDSNGNEIKTFFKNGKWDDESCMIINSRQEFQDAYMGTKELPDVDFSNYTLIIGRTWGNDGSYRLDDIILRENADYYELETKLLHNVDGFATMAIVDIFFWRLYPKLVKKNIIPKRTVVDVKG